MLALPPALQGLANYRQFLLYKVTSDGRKLSVHPFTGEAVDAHDPTVWVDAETACARATATGHGVAFSFQTSDPFFFIDIDSCAVNGDWSPLAKSVMARFPGAAIEVSRSGTGLHIFGCGTAPPHSCKNTVHGMELYTERRFVALTGNGAVGNIWQDFTSHLQAFAEEFFPPRKGDGIDYGEGPRPDWRGPTDDAELLRRALKSQSAGSVFGNKASFAQLWDADEIALGRAFPDTYGKGRPFDPSSADAALAQHLAFWTGCDGERMERLMRMSKLVREKWDHHTSYLGLTVSSARAMARDVLQDKMPEPVPEQQALAAPETAVMPQITPVTGSTYLGTNEQMELFKGCVYVYETHRALVPGGHTIPPEKFKVRYGGYTFTMDAVNERTSRDPWEAFTQSQSYRAPRADRTCFRPDLPPGSIVTSASRTEVNVWWPADTPCQEGDPAPFLRHCEILLPNERDRAILLSYLAAIIQHPGIKFQWCPLIQGAEGNGKTLFTRVIAEAVGQRYTHWARAQRVGAQFNGFLLNRLVVALEDIYLPESKVELWESLKPLITGEMQEIESKGVDQDSRNVCCNFILNSNHKDAVRKTRNDRRLAIFYTAQQEAADVARDMPGDYFQKLYAWLKSGGYGIVHHYLRHYPIPDELNPAKGAQRAPTTSSTDQALSASFGSVEHEVMEAVDQGMQGFKHGWISSICLDNLLRQHHMEGRMPRKKRREMLADLGYFPHPALDDGRVNNPVMPDAGRPRLFVKRDNPAWTITSAAEVAKAYSVAQQT